MRLIHIFLIRLLLITLLFDYLETLGVLFGFFKENSLEVLIPEGTLAACSRGNYINAEFFGGHSEEDPPVPIPNTEVKLFSADGTAWETMWESRSPPIFIEKAPWCIRAKGLFACSRMLIAADGKFFFRPLISDLRPGFCFF